MRKLVFIIAIISSLSSLTVVSAQQSKLIIVENSDFVERNQNIIQDAAIFSGNVRIKHEGVNITCNKAYLFEKENYVKLFGEVQMVQGDTLYLNGKYAEYSGNTKQAFATGNPVMRSPDMVLTTDTINFDRNSQIAYYKNFGKIVNKENTLTSVSGKYLANQKKSEFRTSVVIKNPKYTIKSNNVNFYHNSGHAYLFGPSTITSEKDYIYTENGFYDSKKNTGHFLRKSHIKYNDRLIEGDSLYYDRVKEFASATNNVKITDTINKGIIKGHYGEIYKKQDSMFVTKRAVAISVVENDSVYIHGKKLMITGKEGNRIIRAYNNARFYKSDMNGKCDSIHSSTKEALTKLIGRPVIFNGKNQITGDVIHLIGDNKTEKIDSLKVLTNAFIISKDTLGTGFNQLKGVNLYGKFKDNKLYEVDLIKNTEKLYYGYDKEVLTGIDVGKSSSIKLKLKDNKIHTIRSYTNTESITYPETELPENARKLRGFNWRGDEMILSKEDIFPAEENELHEKILAKSNKEKNKDITPMEVRKETLDYDKNNPSKKEIAPNEK